MSRVFYISAIFAVLCMSGVMAQNTPVNCSSAQQMQDFNATKYVGTWFAVARNPAPSTFMGCVELDIWMYPDNTTMGINKTYANSASMLWQNHTYSANITLDSTNTTGYNVSYNLGSTSSQNTTFKLLATDYTSYAFVCGYTNASDASSSFGVLLTRDRRPSGAALTTMETQAAASYSNFNSSMYNITQTDDCTQNGAATTLPMMTALLVAIFAVLKFIN